MNKKIFFLTLLILISFLPHFPGWKVFVDGYQVPINFQDMNWRGVVTYPVSKGKHEIVVKFSRTRVRLLAELISLVSIIFIPIFLLKTPPKWKP